jgi:hypothetical protein
VPAEDQVATSTSTGGSPEVNPPAEVQVAKWSAAGTLDWWVRERREWFGRVRGPDGPQKWVKAADLRPARNGE